MKREEYLEAVDSLFKAGRGYDAVIDLVNMMSERNEKNERLISLAEAKKRAVLKLIDCGGTMEGIKAIMEDDDDD